MYVTYHCMPIGHRCDILTSMDTHCNGIYQLQRTLLAALSLLQPPGSRLPAPKIETQIRHPFNIFRVNRKNVSANRNCIWQWEIKCCRNPSKAPPHDVPTNGYWNATSSSVNLNVGPISFFSTSKIACSARRKPACCRGTRRQQSSAVAG